MKRFTIILGGALAAQLAVALTLAYSRSDLSAFKAQEPLVAFDAARIDQVDIDESGGGSVTLNKRDGAWVIPSQANFPADGSKVEGLLGKLAGLKAGWPVATTSDAAQRFKVTDKQHERRIVLSSGGKRVSEILVGTSPTYRQVHARVNGANTIHNVAFASYEANARPQDWMNQDLLEIAQDKIASIAIADVNLERKDGKFTVAGVGDNEQMVDREVRALVGAISRPSFDAVQGKGPEALAKLENPDIQFTVKQGDGKTITYRYKKEGDGAAYLFSSSAQDYVFRVGATSIDSIVKAKRDKLVEAKKTDGQHAAKEEPKPTAPAAGSGG
jgi:hypothetical protein